MLAKEYDWKTCPRCGNHPRYVCPVSGLMHMHCVECQDKIEAETFKLDKK